MKIHSTFDRELPTSHSLTYQPYIDGLRAIAVGGVLLSHFDVAGFAGGYLGVDVFFVISGYLITQLIVKAISNGGLSL
jgi:peptidoglycan/LPS O-acetylase OafA/YrhL